MISLKMTIINNNIYNCIYNHIYHSYNWYLLTNKPVTIIIMITNKLYITITIALIIIIEKKLPLSLLV